MCRMCDNQILIMKQDIWIFHAIYKQVPILNTYFTGYMYIPQNQATKSTAPHSLVTPPPSFLDIYIDFFNKRIMPIYQYKHKLIHLFSYTEFLIIIIIIIICNTVTYFHF